MNRIIYYFSLFKSFSKLSIFSILRARFAVFFFLIGKLIRFLFFYIFIHNLAYTAKSIGDFSPSFIILVFLTYSIIDALGQMIFREVYKFKPLVVSGDFDIILTKPYNPLCRCLLGGIDILDAITLIPYIGALVYYLVLIKPDLVSFLFYLLFLINSMLIIAGIHLLTLTVTLINPGADQTIMVYRDISSLGKYPTSIYNRPLQFALTYIIPVGIMVTFPVLALFNKMSTLGFLFTLLFSLLFVFFGIFSWNRGQRVYQGWGG